MFCEIFLVIHRKVLSTLTTSDENQHISSYKALISGRDESCDMK